MALLPNDKDVGRSAAHNVVTDRPSGWCRSFVSKGFVFSAASSQRARERERERERCMLRGKSCCSGSVGERNSEGEDWAKRCREAKSEGYI